METQGHKLHDFQKEAVEKLRTGSILCGGVGSGKTLVSLEYFSKMIPPWYQLYIITTARKRDTKDWEKEAEIYSLIPIVDSWNNINKYVYVKDAFFIFDEQRVIGAGKWVKAFLTIVKSNDWILLSATPGDTWLDYIPVFVANGFFKNRTEFLIKHVRFRRFSNYPVIESYINELELERLKSLILVYMEYRKPAESVYTNINVEFDNERIAIVEKRHKDPITNLPIRNASEYLFVLRKIINTHPSRLGTIMSLLDKHNRIIVFYNYDYELDILRELGTSVEIAEWNGHKHEPRFPSGDQAGS